MPDGQISRYLENKLSRLTLRGEPYTPPTVVYLGLFTSVIEEDPSPMIETMKGTEVSGGGYARQPIAFTAPVDGLSSNVSTVTFPTPNSAWGRISHWGVFDAGMSGHMMYFGALSPVRDYTSGQQVVVSPGRITVRLD